MPLQGIPRNKCILHSGCKLYFIHCSAWRVLSRHSHEWVCNMIHCFKLNGLNRIAHPLMTLAWNKVMSGCATYDFTHARIAHPLTLAWKHSSRALKYALLKIALLWSPPRLTSFLRYSINKRLSKVTLAINQGITTEALSFAKKHVKRYYAVPRHSVKTFHLWFFGPYTGK